MARTLGAAASEVAQQFGSEPIFIVEITWGVDGPTVSYADKTFDGIEGKILDLSAIDAVMKIGGGSTGSVTLVLDDTDETIKTQLNERDIQKGLVNIYQTYASLTAADKFLVFTGEISTPIERSEAEATVTIAVVSQIEDKELGFSPEDGEFDFIADSAIGVAWPLCFGSPLRVPAVQITDRVRGKSLTKFGLITYSELERLCDAAGDLADIEIDKELADTVTTGLVAQENYNIILENMSGALATLNTLKESLLAGAPNKEDDLSDYIDACRELRLAQNRLTFWLDEYETRDATVEEREESITELTAQYWAAIADGDAAAAAAIQVQLNVAMYGDATTDSLNTLEVQRQQALNQVSNALTSIDAAETDRDTLARSITTIDLEEIIVQNGEDFPQATTVTIVINNMKFTGTFSGEVFTIDAANVPYDQSVALGARQNTNANELWVSDAGIRLKNKYCWLGDAILYVTEQEDTRCYFNPILWEEDAYYSGGSFSLQTYVERLFDTSDVILQTAVVLRQEWLDVLETLDPDDELTFATGLTNIQDQDYAIDIGDEVYLDEDHQSIYIANLIPSTEVKEVLAYRTINGVSELKSVPTRYYSVDLNESIAGQNATTIRLIRPLEDYVDEQWESQLYVSLISSVGPNTADIIEWLLTTYSDLTVDATSFASVASSLTNYPSHFALLQRSGTLKTVEEIAWQARCAAYVRNGVVFLKYLSTEGTPIYTLDESDVVETSFVLAHTRTEDLVTKLVAEWTRDYAEGKVDFVLRNNVTLYGEFEEKFNFYIYNIRSLVEKSATFWLLRLSNTWKKVRCTTFLQTLILEEFDSVELDFADNLISSSAVTGVVEEAIYDSNNHRVDYEIWTPVRAGYLTQYIFAYPADAAADAEFPTEDDQYSGSGN